MITKEFFDIFESQLIDILKFNEFDIYYILEIKKKIDILQNLENIKTPLAKKLPPSALSEITTLILELFDE